MNNEIEELKKKRDQLYWFVDKLISVSKDPAILENYDEVICFPVELLKKEADLFPLGRYERHSVGFKNADEEYASYCKEMLEKIKKDIYKLKDISLNFDEKKFSWDEDNGYLGFGHILIIDYYYKPLFEAYLRYMNGEKTESKLGSLKGKKVEFDEITSAIIIDGKRCPLPIARNEDYLARAMFSREIGEGVDWSIIYKEMTGSEVGINNKSDKKSLDDTIERLNDRIKRILGVEDKLISCEHKSVKRNY